MIRSLLCVLAFAVGESVGVAAQSNPQSPDRPRVVLLTDYWKDPDEIQAMIRFLCYANEFEIEGLIATSLAYGDGAVHPDWIEDILGDYAKVYGHLRQHERPGYPFPAPESLKRTVRAGAPVIRKFVGPGKGFAVPFPAGERDSRVCEPADNWLRADRISAGSNHIIEVVDRADPRPVWVLVWGGAMDLAQVIWKVRHERTPAEAARFIAKLRLHQSNWQDTGTVWIWSHVPELFFVFTNIAKGGLNTESPEELRDEAWVRKHLLEGHGPLAARYPAAPVGGRIKIKEGDTPTFLYLLAPGLSDPEQPEWGGWGGRRERFAPGTSFYVDGRDRHPSSHDPTRECYWSLARWSEAISRDFAARLDWCVKDYYAANHPPMAHVNGDATTHVLQRTVTAGETVVCDATGSSEPDGDRLSFKWWQYVEPGSLREPVRLENADMARMTFVAPAVSASCTLHVILEVRDSGDPPLTSYRRVVVTIAPPAAPKERASTVGARPKAP